MVLPFSLRLAGPLLRPPPSSRRPRTPPVLCDHSDRTGVPHGVCRRAGSRDPARRPEVGQPTALSASTSPEPNQPFWPRPPWHRWAAPSSTPGKKAYGETSAGHGIGLTAFCRATESAPPVLPVTLAIRAATPAACGEAIE